MTNFTFDQINDALSSATPCYVTRERDEDGDRGYALRDGCGDQDGDLFYALDDLIDYITNNSDVRNYLQELA